jgi:hypothetical protein
LRLKNFTASDAFSGEVLRQSTDRDTVTLHGVPLHHPNVAAIKLIPQLPKGIP